MSTSKKPNGAYTPSRENLQASGTLGALNAEIIIDLSDATSGGIVGGGEGLISLDLRGTFSATFVIEATIDGTNWQQVSFTSGQLNTTVAGFYQAICAGYKKVRVRCSAYTSGSTTTVLVASICSTLLQGALIYPTALGTANTALTLTIPAVAGMRFYMTGLYINRVNGTATAVTGSALLAITTANLPTNTGWSTDNALAAWSTRVDVDQKFTNPIVSSVANTATSITAPAGGAGVQYRIQAEGYYAP